VQAANVGLSAIFFANLFPEARIIALEPESSNFEMLAANVAPYPKITPLRAALWHENKRISLVDPGLGKWGFITHDETESAFAGTPNGLVQALTLDRLMDDYGLDHIDLLKLDIEGAEREVFDTPGAWIDRVDAILVELHDRLKPGCSRNFYVATRGFELEWSKGQVIGVAREHSAVIGASRRRSR
jgi:FkbM family methyltransferase